MEAGSWQQRAVVEGQTMAVGELLKQQFRALAALQDARAYVPHDELALQAGVSLVEGGDLQRALIQNPKVTIREFGGVTHYRYTSALSTVRDLNALLQELDRRPVPEEELSDAYGGAREDLFEAAARARVFALKRRNANKVVFSTRRNGREFLVKLPGAATGLPGGRALRTEADLCPLVRRGDAVVVVPQASHRDTTTRRTKEEGGAPGVWWRPEDVYRVSAEARDEAGATGHRKRYGPLSHNAVPFSSTSTEDPRTPAAGFRFRFDATTLPLDRALPAKLRSGGTLSVYKFGATNDLRAVWHQLSTPKKGERLLTQDELDVKLVRAGLMTEDTVARYNKVKRKREQRERARQDRLRVQDERLRRKRRRRAMGRRGKASTNAHMLLPPPHSSMTTPSSS